MTKIHFLILLFVYTSLKTRAPLKILTFKNDFHKQHTIGKCFTFYLRGCEGLLHIAKVPSLQIRRMRTMALECFKILYKLSRPCLNDLVVIKKK